MKIKRIKKITIGSYELKIIWDKNKYDSSFSFIDCEIKIGVKSGLTNEIFSSIMHEIIEAHYTCFELRLGVPNGDYLFNFSHKEFNMVNMLIADSISKFIK